jgi:hypothetical protein
MKKSITIACIAASATIIFSQLGGFDALVMFLLAGIIPGTNSSVPSNVMFLLIMGSMSLIILHLTGKRVLDYFYKLTQPKPASTKKHLPKRRFGQI